MTLPPLPETGERSPTDCSPLFTASQMQAYAQAAVLAEREECAKLCDTREADHWHDYKDGPVGVRGMPACDHASDEARACAEAIRARSLPADTQG